jgi:hypothetical protein
VVLLIETDVAVWGGSMTERTEATEPESEGQVYAEITGQSTIVHNYRYFYYLANEMAYFAHQEAERNDDTPLNEYRYSIASVIFSFTFVDGYFSHLMHSPNSPVHQVFDAMNVDEKDEIERLRLSEKVEYVILHYPESKASKLDKGSEPFQSFDLVRQLRNLLIHYKPTMEVKWSSSADYKREVRKLERQVAKKFAFNARMQNQAFVYRCFSEDCAKWSLVVSRDFVNWLSESLSIRKPILEEHWPLAFDTP